MAHMQGAASFTQTRHLSGVRAPLISTGRATIGADRIEWHVTQPMDIRTTISASGVTQSIEGGAPQRVGPQGGGDAFLSSAGLLDLLSGDFASLRAHYDVAPQAADGGDWRLRLTPRAATLARFVASIEVGGCEHVKSVRVRQANGDWMDIALTPVGS